MASIIIFGAKRSSTCLAQAISWQQIQLLVSSL